MRLVRLLSSIVAPALVVSCVNGADLYSDETLTWKATLLRKHLDGTSGAKSVTEAEWPDDRTPYANKIAYARNLAEYYMFQAGKVSDAKDIAAAGLIGTAAVTAGGLFYGAGLGLVKATGLAAGTITASTNYARPEEAEAALLSAAEALMCIASVAQAGKASFKKDEVTAAGVLYDATLTVRLNLRGKLARKLPDYKTLLDNFRTSVAKPALLEGPVTDIDGLRVRTAECILRAGA